MNMLSQQCAGKDCTRMFLENGNFYFLIFILIGFLYLGVLQRNIMSLAVTRYVVSHSSPFLSAFISFQFIVFSADAYTWFQEGASNAKDVTVLDKLEEESKHCPNSSSEKLPLMIDKYTYYRKKLSRKQHVSRDVPVGTAEVKAGAVTCEKIGLKKCQTELSFKGASLQPVGKLKSSLPGDNSAAAKMASRKVTKVSRTVQSMSVCMIFILVFANTFVVLNSGFVNWDLLLHFYVGAFVNYLCTRLIAYEKESRSNSCC